MAEPDLTFEDLIAPLEAEEFFARYWQRDYLHLLIKYGLEAPEHLEDSPTPTRIPGPVDVVNLGESAAS